jgi:hypothetical protein
MELLNFFELPECLQEMAYRNPDRDNCGAKVNGREDGFRRLPAAS